MTDFDPNMTYWQSLRIVARGLIQWPMRQDDWDLFMESLKDVLYYGLSPLVRLLSLLLLPISAPLLTWLVQIERRRTAARRSSIATIRRENRQRFVDERSQNNKEAK